MIIELIGLPGAGKSTLADTLAAELARRGRPTRVATRGVDSGTPTMPRLRNKARLALSHVRTHPRASLKALRLIIASQSSPSAALRRAVVWLVAQQLTADAGVRRGDVILDEGSLQAVWSLGVAGDHRSMLEVWLARPAVWLAPDVVVVVAPPLATVERRLRRRSNPHSRVEKLQGSARRDLLEHGGRMVQEVAQSASRLGVRPPEVVWLEDGDFDTVEASAARVATLLIEVLGTRATKAVLPAIPEGVVA